MFVCTKLWFVLNYFSLQPKNMILSIVINDFFLAVLTVIVRKNQTLPLVLRSTTKKNVNVPPNSKYRPKDCFVKPKHVAKLCINCYILMCESGKKTLY